MKPSQVFDPELHDAGSISARGQCSHHAKDSTTGAACDGTAVVSFEDQDGEWQSGCRLALEQLVEAGEIEPLGQGA